MTDTPPDPFELASAYLDGALDEADRARVGADPELVALVGELGRVQEWVRADVGSPSPDLRDRAIATALSHVPSGASPVTSLESARRRRAQRLARLLPVGAGIAAAIALIAVISLGGGSDDDDEAATIAFDGRSSVAVESTVPKDDDLAMSAEAAPDGGTAEFSAPAEVLTGPAEDAAETTAAASPASQAPTVAQIATLHDLGELDDAPSVADIDALALPAPPPDAPCSGTAVARLVLAGVPSLILVDGEGGYLLAEEACTVIAPLAP